MTTDSTNTTDAGIESAPAAPFQRLVHPFYEQDGITIYNARCEMVLPSFAGGEFSAVVTSPPYNLGVNPHGNFGHWKDGMVRGGNGSWNGVNATGINYGGHDDAMPYAEYRDWQQAILRDCWRVTSQAVFYVHKPRPQRETLWTPLDLNPGLPIRQIVIWDRGSGFNRCPTWFVPSHEWIIVFAREEFRLTTRSVDDVWRIPPDANNSHPAPFPVGLAERAITSFACDSVFDPFMGSGSTLVAAKRAGIRAVGCDTNERFCEQAANRLRQGMLPLVG